MCELCEQIPSYDDIWDNYWDNEIPISSNMGYTRLYMGVNKDGSYYIAASGDDRAWYTPNYCPECGRKLVD